MVVALDPLDLLRDVLPEVIRHLDVPASDDDVHATSCAVMRARRARLRTAASSARRGRHTTGTRAGDGVTPPLPRSCLTVAESARVGTPPDPMSSATRLGLLPRCHSAPKTAEKSTLSTAWQSTHSNSWRLFGYPEFLTLGSGHRGSAGHRDSGRPQGTRGVGDRAAGRHHIVNDHHRVRGSGQRRRSTVGGELSGRGPPPLDGGQPRGVGSVGGQPEHRRHPRGDPGPGQHPGGAARRAAARAARRGAGRPPRPRAPAPARPGPDRPARASHGGGERGRQRAGEVPAPTLLVGEQAGPCRLRRTRRRRPAAEARPGTDRDGAAGAGPSSRRHRRHSGPRAIGAAGAAARAGPGRPGRRSRRDSAAAGRTRRRPDPDLWMTVRPVDDELSA